MKTRAFLMVLSVLIIHSLSLAAYLEYDSESIWSQSRCTATDPNSNDDSGNVVDWKNVTDPLDTDVYADTSAMTTDEPDITTADCWASATMGYIEQFDEAGGLQIYADGNAYAETYTADATGYAYGAAAGVSVGESTGVFFRIMPDAGEQIGDTVEISLSWMAEVQVTGQGWAACNNGFLGLEDPGSGIVVAVNPTDRNNPPLSSRVWQRPVVEVNGDGFADDSDQAAFTAQIGDVIGVFMGVDNEVTVGGQEAGDVYSFQEMSLAIQYIGGPVYTAADADINGSGRVDLGDLAILAQFWLQDVQSGSDGSTCQQAIDIPTFSTVSGDNIGALTSPVTTCGGGNDGNGVWYKFTSPGDMFVEILLEPLDFDSTLAIYDACGEIELDCDEFINETITYGMSPEETIYIRVAGYDLEEGSFQLTVREPIL